MASYKNLRFQYLLELLKSREENGASFSEIKDYIERRFEDKDIPLTTRNALLSAIKKIS